MLVVLILIVLSFLTYDSKFLFDNVISDDNDSGKEGGCSLLSVLDDNHNSDDRREVVAVALLELVINDDNFPYALLFCSFKCW